MMTYREYDKDKYVYDIGQSADSFFVVLNGQAAVEIENPNIDRWEWAHGVYTALLDWKQNTFDPYAKKSLEEHEAQ